MPACRGAICGFQLQLSNAHERFVLSKDSGTPWLSYGGHVQRVRVALHTSPGGWVRAPTHALTHTATSGSRGRLHVYQR